MTPRTDLASSTYCLAAPGAEYLVYVPEEPARIAAWLASARFLWPLAPAATRLSSWVQRWRKPAVTVDLTAASGTLAVEWFDPATSSVVARETIGGGAVRSFVAPVRGDAVLYIAVQR
jgi:hypothetical protein